MAGQGSVWQRLMRNSRSRLSSPPAVSTKPSDADPDHVARQLPRWWRQRLWAGFVTESIDAFEQLKFDPTVLASVRANSLLQLASWHLANGDAAAAYEHAVLARVAVGNMQPQHEQPAVEVDALIALEQFDQAQTLIAPMVERAPSDVNLLLRQANAHTDDHQRLAAINGLFTAAGLAPIIKRDGDAPLSIDNLASSASGASVTGPLVTVIVPAFQAQAELETALRSLVAQTWQSLQIIVVDDASNDDTAQVAQRFAATDARIQVVRCDTNGGAYVARNIGLEAATGDYVTVHDADDWSHPQKIEQHLRAIDVDQGRCASVSQWVRVAGDVRMTWSLRPSIRLLHRNYSSLMVRRDVFARLGWWDNVRVLGDVEFFDRLTAVYGPDAISLCQPDVPLTFARRSAGSLTASGRHAAYSRLSAFGARRLYADAFRWWHASDTLTDDLPYHPDTSNRPFPAPRSLLPAMPPNLQSVVLVADLRHPRFIDHHLPKLGKVLQPGASVLDVPAIDGDVDAPVAAAVLAAMRAAQATFVTEGDALTVDHVVVAVTGQMTALPRNPPKLTARLVTMVDDSDDNIDRDVTDALLAACITGPRIWVPLTEAGQVAAAIATAARRGPVGSAGGEPAGSRQAPGEDHDHA